MNLIISVRHARISFSRPALIVCIGCALALGATAYGQDEAAPPPQQQDDTGAQTSDESQQQEQKQGAPSLDDLLGIEGDQQDRSAADAAQRDNEEELRRQLNEEEIRDAFEQAIKKMSISAELLDQRFDPGLGTQRVQEDIIAKLDQLIDSCKKCSGQSGSSSSSSSSSQQASAQPKNSPRKSQPNQNQQANAGNKRNNASDSQEGDPPPQQEGDINTVLEETRSEWGSLPQRVRDLIVQGRQGKYSSLYQSFTAEYYKRLAEEGTP